jgi:hypothetical protein
MSQSHAESAKSLRSFLSRHPDLYALYFGGTSVALQGLVVRYWRDLDIELSIGDLKLLRPLRQRMDSDAEFFGSSSPPPHAGGFAVMPNWSSGSLPTGGPTFRV